MLDANKFLAMQQLRNKLQTENRNQILTAGRREFFFDNGIEQLFDIFDDALFIFPNEGVVIARMSLTDSWNECGSIKNRAKKFPIWLKNINATENSKSWFVPECRSRNTTTSCVSQKHTRLNRQ